MKAPAITLDHRCMPPTFAKMFQAAFPSYRGHMFKLAFCETLDVRSYWSGGSRDEFTFLRVDNGKAFRMPPQSAFDPRALGAEAVTITERMVCVEHSIFCGKDMGLTLHLPESVSAQVLEGVLENAPQVTRDEMVVLTCTASLKASYDGRKPRIDRAWECYNLDLAGWEKAKASLIERKLLNRAGAITPAGRNAVALGTEPAELDFSDRNERI